jgi:xanthine/CO dehydrogenase XdhC/CoxF family maturation factor
MGMGELQDIIGRLERIGGPVALATLLKVDGPGPGRAGARRILVAAGGAPVTALDEALQGVAVTGRTRMLAGVSGPELDPWRGGVLLERMVPGKLPPWVHFCAQVLRRGGACVLATVGAVEGDVPYALGDRFVYDERNHGLLPMDGRFSLDLQRGCEKVREAGQPAWKRFDLPGGSLGICLEPLP